MDGRFIQVLLQMALKSFVKPIWRLVEGENTRLRHYLARLHRKSGKTQRRRKAPTANACQDTLCYSKSKKMLEHSIRLLLHYLRFWDVPVPYIKQYSHF